MKQPDITVILVREEVVNLVMVALSKYQAKKSLAGNFVNKVDTTAVNGETGTLLLDPTDIEILDGTNDSDDDDDASNTSFIDTGGSNTIGSNITS